MKQRIGHSQRGFTIVELLVVVSIIALLVGILLPAIGKARDQAQLTRSQSNIRQIGTSIQSYAAEYADRQPTFINDNISTYGNFQPGGAGAFQNFATKHGGEGHPWLWLGWYNGGSGAQIVGWASPPDPDQTYAYQPIKFQAGTGQYFGSFRLPNAKAINNYMNGRFYDEVYYAPKDTSVYGAAEKWFGIPNEFHQDSPGHKWSSYCMSPAAMFNPAVLMKNNNGTYFTDPFMLASGFKSPGLGQAQFSNLKTHVMEHHWLQGRKKQCHPSLVDSNNSYNGCIPYFFNAAVTSSPVTLFYDGHVAALGIQDAIEANKLVAAQFAGNSQTGNNGLWSINTPFGGSFGDGGSGGYYSDYAYDWASNSCHILTIDGIKGRDIISK